ncbi:MAG: hypothetical protein ATN33_00380 [Epulopiscium sp. Nele67-Bin001]|nr:MAG: hypothetical protein ATN33_00380 [Epulopiscium sp. Nele67-Bin001]
MRSTEQETAKIITVGKKARDQFRSKGYDIVKEVTGISENPVHKDAQSIAQFAADMYKNGEVSEIYLAYTSFKSTIAQEPTLVRLLPLDLDIIKENAPVDEEDIPDLLLYEPSVEEVLGYIIPRYLADITFGGLIEAAASEQGARMTAMDTATENAQEMLGKLNIVYNRARQAAITQELTEIVSGAEAL